MFACGIFIYLFYKIPPHQVWKGLANVSVLPLVLFGVGYFGCHLCLDTWGLSRVISQFSHQVNFRELLPARCISYLLALVNYNAGQAALALYLKRIKQASFFKTLGAVFFISVTDLYWIILLAFLGSFFLETQVQDLTLKTYIRTLSYVAAAAFFLHLAFWNRWFSRLFPFRFHFAFSDWLRGRHLFQPFHHAKLRDYLKIGLFRLPIHLMMIASFWILFRIFHLNISWGDTLVFIPIILLIGALPITPGGLGTVQVATIELLKNRVHSPLFATGEVTPQELLFAISLTWMALNYLLKAIAGTAFWLKGSGEIIKGAKAETVTDAMHSNS